MNDSDYSNRKESAGLEIAAFIDWKLIVKAAIKKAKTADIKNISHVTEIL